MVEIKLNPERPSENIIRAANAPLTAIDSTGRKITIRRLKPLDRMRLFELVGPENVKNEMYYGYAALAYSVTDIDGNSVPVLANKIQLEGLVQELDEHGMDAVGAAIEKSQAETQKTAEAAKDAVKNA